MKGEEENSDIKGSRLKEIREDKIRITIERRINKEKTNCNNKK